MKLALECPTSLLQQVQPFADFDWVLAKEVLSNETYADFYRSSPRSKFVDNSVNELGEPCSIEDLVKAFEIVKGNYMVAPDWLGDSAKTISSYLECVKQVGSEDVVVGVVQGEVFEDAFSCITYYKGILAIPYDICSTKEDPPWLMALRRALLVSHIPNDKLIHLLGFNSMDEFYWYRARPNILSIDTGVPVLYGLLGKDILDPLESKANATYNLMKDLKFSNKEWTAICRNIALLRRYIS